MAKGTCSNTSSVPWLRVIGRGSLRSGYWSQKSQGSQNLPVHTDGRQEVLGVEDADLWVPDPPSGTCLQGEEREGRRGRRGGTATRQWSQLRPPTVYLFLVETFSEKSGNTGGKACFRRCDLGSLGNASHLWGPRPGVPGSPEGGLEPPLTTQPFDFSPISTHGPNGTCARRRPQ